MGPPTFTVDMSAVVWIVTSTGGLRADMGIVPWTDLDAIDKVRVDLVPCASPRQKRGCWPDWLHQAAQDADFDLASSWDRKAEYRIIGLARLSSRCLVLHRGPLTNPYREGRLLLDIYRDPLDSFLLKVVDSVELVEPIAVKLRRRQGRQRHNIFICLLLLLLWRSAFYVARSSLEPAIGPDLSKQLFYPLLPDGYSTALSDGTLLGEKLREWRCDGSESRLLAQLLPDPIASLIVKGFFHLTLALARSPLHAELFPGDVPSKEWVDASKPLHMQALGWGGQGDIPQAQRANEHKQTRRIATTKNNRLRVWA